MRILATKMTVDTLFKPCSVPYGYTDNSGKVQNIDIPGWECRACGWTSLKGVHDLPFAHNCPQVLTGSCGADQTFTVGH